MTSVLIGDKGDEQLETEIGMMSLQAKEFPGSLAATGS